MTNQTFHRYALEENAWQRRDVAATPEQKEEVRQAAAAFRHARVLMSRARLRGEAYLQRN